MDGLERTGSGHEAVDGMFLNIAHRGDSSNAPENTMSAFEAAIAAGASAVELDLRRTADGQVVVMHDRRVDRTTDGEGALESLSFERVRGLDAGAWFGERYAGERVPTLEEVFDRLVERVPLVLHVKEAGVGIERAVADQVLARGVADRVCVSSNHVEVIESIGRLVPGITTTWIAWFRDWRWWMWYVAGKVRRLGARRVAPPATRVTRPMVEYFHSQEIAVRAWGVGRDEALATRLISYGVDGMTFDDPGRLAELLATNALPANSADSSAKDDS